MYYFTAIQIWYFQVCVNQIVTPYAESTSELSRFLRLDPD